MRPTIERILALKALYLTAWNRALASGDMDEIDRCQTRAHAATARIAEIVA